MTAFDMIASIGAAPQALAEIYKHLAVSVAHTTAL